MAHTSTNFLNEEDLFTKEELEIRDTIRSFVAAEVEPHLREAHRSEKFPSPLIRRFGEMGVLGSNIQGYECPGLGDVAYGLIMQELEAADSGIRSFCSVQGALVMYPISAFGSEELKQKYLPSLTRGEIIGCFGLTEPDAGSNPGGMKTKAVKVKGGYELTGTKMWITNGNIADIAIVWAKLEGKVHGFVVDTKAKGFKAQLIQGKFSLRVSVTSELILDKVFVPEDHLLTGLSGLKAPLSCLTQARYGISFGVVGAATRCFNEALTYSSTREIFDKPLSHYQLAQAKLVKMVQEITKAQLMCVQIGRLKESKKLKPEQVSLVKMNNCRMALGVAREARDMLGANGIMDEYPVIRHLLNLETVNTYEGTEDIHRLVVGQALTGVAAFK
jgi:glutaryl-CoA dehydrogenase